MTTRRRKKTLFIVAALLLLSSVSAWAILPALAVFAPQLIGATLATVVVGSAVTKIAQSPAGTFVADTTTLKVPIVAYSTIVRAGVESAYGYATSIPWDFKTAWNNGMFEAVPAIQTIASATFPSTVLPPALGAVAASFTPCGPYAGVTKQRFLSRTVQHFGYRAATSVPAPVCSNGLNVHIENAVLLYAGAYEWDSVETRWTPATAPDEVVNYPPPAGGVPETLTDMQAEQLAANLAAAQSDIFIRDALQNAVAANPGLLSAPAVQGAAIPADAIPDLAVQVADAAKQQQIDTLKEAVLADPSNIPLQAELEKAIAEQAQQKADDIKDAPETYAPLNVAAFAVPYSPGAFNIPARLTGFFNTVKASPIFSFSTSFFSSLPTGGDSTFTIDGGTYGTHTVDVAETMAPGLVFLSKLFLVVFGFLSIRTIILKR